MGCGSRGTCGECHWAFSGLDSSKLISDSKSIKCQLFQPQI